MKKIFRGFFLAVLICVLAVGSLAGCKLSGDGEFDEKLLDEIDLTADESFSGELNIRTTSEESEVVIMNALIKAFNEKYPYIRVNYTQELLDNYYSSLSNDAGTAETLGDYSLMPDVFWLRRTAWIPFTVWIPSCFRWAESRRGMKLSPRIFWWTKRSPSRR